MTDFIGFQLWVFFSMNRCDTQLCQFLFNSFKRYSTVQTCWCRKRFIYEYLHEHRDQSIFKPTSEIFRAHLLNFQLLLFFPLSHSSYRLRYLLPSELVYLIFMSSPYSISFLHFSYSSKMLAILIQWLSIITHHSITHTHRILALTSIPWNIYIYIYIHTNLLVSSWSNL